MERSFVRIGQDAMIFKISLAKKWQKIAFLTQNKAKFSKILIIVLFFEKNTNLIIK
jgi:hypothetical protein